MDNLQHEWQLYFNVEGHVLTHSGPADDWSKTVNVTASLAFLESIMPLIFAEGADSHYSDVFFPAVEAQLGSKRGIFDFSLIKIWFNQREAVFCHVLDKTEYYSRCREKQQELHEQKLEMERIEYFQQQY